MLTVAISSDDSNTGSVKMNVMDMLLRECGGTWFGITLTSIGL